jgi:hypothetical protein
MDVGPIMHQPSDRSHTASTRTTGNRTVLGCEATAPATAAARSPDGASHLTCVWLLIDGSHVCLAADLRMYVCVHTRTQTCSHNHTYIHAHTHTGDTQRPRAAPPCALSRTPSPTSLRTQRPMGRRQTTLALRRGAKTVADEAARRIWRRWPVH